jgi:hypothetical protein
MLLRNIRIKFNMSKYAIDSNKPHLGGNFFKKDPATFCPSAWKYIIEKFQFQSVTDVGSGKGYAGKWFFDQGLDTTCIEGLEENVNNSLYPAILHDLTERPFIKSVDFVNCIEVVEHIEEQYLENLLTTLCQGRYLLMTHAIPGQKGWHHVNCQLSDYWINHLKSKNFELLTDDTKTIQNLANNDGAKHIARNGMLFQRKIKV